MNRSPLGPLPQLMCGNLGRPVFSEPWLRVVDEIAAAASGPVVAPDVEQVEVVADLVRRGAAEVERGRAVPSVPKAVVVMTTPSVSGGRRGNWA